LKIESVTLAHDWKQRYGEDFEAYPVAFRRLKAECLSEPRLVCVSEAAAACLGMTAIDFETQAEIVRDCFAHGEIPRAFLPDNPASHSKETPHAVHSMATVYAGHQFGVWAGQLGDGRALLLGDLHSFAEDRDWGIEQTPVTGAQESSVDSMLDTGNRIEVQLKGSGQTPYSRMGDGRAVLRSSIREFLASEAMIALGVPSTRALCLYRSDDPVFRETTETAAVLTRLAPSFLRFGHVEFFAHFQHHEALEHLLWTLANRHYPKVLRGSELDSNRPETDRSHRQHRLDDRVKLKLLKAIAARTGALIAHWQSIGFCHGVMNTDNMSLLGLTLDYGPFGFLDQYDEDHICNHSDHRGRYSYSNQPAVGAWNCRALAVAFQAVLSEESALELPDCLAAYRNAFETNWRKRFAMKFGLVGTAGVQDPSALSPEFNEVLDRFLARSMEMLKRCKPDFTLFFRHLSRFPVQTKTKPSILRDMVLDPARFDH